MARIDRVRAEHHPFDAKCLPLPSARTIIPRGVSASVLSCIAWRGGGIEKSVILRSLRPPCIVNLKTNCAPRS
ncbi:hypothetical protein COCVIDRAFT_94031 [Bipolaris victoriae FI3]|uniref:Uncharacterized protein n=1 Tax=Bipolaris victoriae (strain FI3) TaxID=930091 RepID=W7EY88_BIPV3|nr:hypothetical protein COCVIDRAFT_94031 [Bipolaris victoriae FI3]